MSVRATRQYRGDSAETRRLERRERFVAAARHIFGNRGFHGATVRGICEEAGLTERYFYESFENSEALFIAMHKDTSEHIISEIIRASDLVPGTPFDKARAMVTAYYDDIQRDPARARLFAVDAGYISPAAREVCGSWRNAFGLLLAHAFNAGGSAPDPIVRSGVIKGLLGIGVDWMDDRFATPVERIVDAGMSIAVVLQIPQQLDQPGRAKPVVAAAAS